MASGNTLYCWTVALANEPTATNYATFDTRNLRPVLDFDADTAEAAVVSGILPRHYSGGGITVYLHFSATGITSGNVVFTAAFERVGNDILDGDTDSFASANSVTVAVSATDGNIKITSIAFTDGSQIDSLAIGEGFRLKITRDAASGSDTAAADAELHYIEIRET